MHTIRLTASTRQARLEAGPFLGEDSNGQDSTPTGRTARILTATWLERRGRSSTTKTHASGEHGQLSVAPPRRGATGRGATATDTPGIEAWGSSTAAPKPPKGRRGGRRRSPAPKLRPKKQSETRPLARGSGRALRDA